MDPNGAIRALVGGRNYAESQFNRAVAAKRQPGSAFKPFVYLTALERGLTPETVREDGPINVKGWRPENYSREYFGPVTLTNALALSLNTVAVKLGLEVGPKAVVSTARRLGIQSELQPNASIALGTSEVTPLELVTAYAPFANGGIGVQPHIITRVRTADGKLLYQRRGSSNGRLIEPQYVAMMNQMMSETLTIGTGRKGAAGLAGGRQDRHQPGFPRRLVRRLHERAGDRRLARQRRFLGYQTRVWRQSAGRGVEQVHARRAEGPAGRGPAGRRMAAGQPADARAARFPSRAGRIRRVRPPRRALTPPNRRLRARPGQPVQLGRARSPRRMDDLLPPENVGERSAAREGGPREKNFLEKLFGG